MAPIHVRSVIMRPNAWGAVLAAIIAYMDSIHEGMQRFEVQNNEQLYRSMKDMLRFYVHNVIPAIQIAAGVDQWPDLRAELQDTLHTVGLAVPENMEDAAARFVADLWIVPSGHPLPFKNGDSDAAHPETTT